jgi:hypothetical protein
VVARLSDGTAAIPTLAVDERQRFVFAGTVDGRLLVFTQRSPAAPESARSPMLNVARYDPTARLQFGSS